MERFRMLKAKRRRLREEQEAMDGVLDPVRTRPPSTSPTLPFLSEAGMYCSSQSPHPHPTKRTCLDLSAASVLVLKEEDPVSVDISTNAPKGVSKLDPPAAVKRPPPARCVDFGAAVDLMNNNGTGGVDQEGQDDKEEEIRRRDDTRDKGDGITEEANDGLYHDDEVNGQERNESHLEAPRQKRTIKSFKDRLEQLKSYKAKHGHVHVTVKQDKVLGKFCVNMRSARRGKENGTGTSRTVITEDRIKALDELGFDWGEKTKTKAKAKSFEDRIEELKAFKAKHGHVHVTVKQDKSLVTFCKNTRAARRGTRGTGRMPITDNRISALDELGFDWAPGP